MGPSPAGDNLSRPNRAGCLLRLPLHERLYDLAEQSRQTRGLCVSGCTGEPSEGRPAIAPGDSLARSLQRQFELQTLNTLKVTDHFERITRLRVPYADVSDLFAEPRSEDSRAPLFAVGSRETVPRNPLAPPLHDLEPLQSYNALMAENHDDVSPGRSSIDDIIELYKKDVDRTLLREALRLTPTQRLQRLVELTRFTERLRQAEKKTAP